MLQTLLQFVQLLLTTGNLCIMLFALYQFTRRPHQNLTDRVIVLEQLVKAIQESLARGNNRFNEIDRAINILTQNVLALVEFEIQYCLTENKEPSSELREAKHELNKYVSSNKR